MARLRPSADAGRRVLSDISSNASIELTVYSRPAMILRSREVSIQGGTGHASEGPSPVPRPLPCGSAQVVIWMINARSLYDACGDRFARYPLAVEPAGTARS